tara:strand:+ start:270 stop:497 length:228 start_codon:yes stop_codon:yes gene_type:complete
LTNLDQTIENAPSLLTTEQVAKIFPYYTANTLRVSRYRGNSPFPYIKINKKVMYEKEEIIRILGNNTVDEKEFNS